MNAVTRGAQKGTWASHSAAAVLVVVAVVVVVMVVDIVVVVGEGKWGCGGGRCGRIGTRRVLKDDTDRTTQGVTHLTQLSCGEDSCDLLRREG